ncbi:MAG: phosphoglucosamine mutase [Candidatus Latescibacterota bacterium]
MTADISKLLFSVAGARGIVGESIDEDVVKRLTLAFGSIMPPGTIVIGRDTRPSGESLSKAAIGAIRTTGHDCIDIGIATTPTVEMMVEKLGASGGIIVTASHNPIEWNALKFLNRQGIFIDQKTSEHLYEVFTGNKFKLAGGYSLGKVQNYNQASKDHIDAILALQDIDVAKIRERNFTVVLDCINGAGSVIAPQLLAALGVEAVCIDCKTNGDFHRNPEPRPDNLTDLAGRVVKEQAAVGFALDPDADRLALVNEKGKAVSEEYTLALVVDHILTTRGGSVVVNLSTSSIIDAIAERHGAEVSRTPVGEAHVVSAMLASDAVIGGEGNGGVIYPALHPGRDGLLAMALILQLLAERRTTISELMDAFPPFTIAKEKAPKDGHFSQERISQLIRQLKPVKIDTRDGVKAVFEDGWFHLRVSNTEGIVRIIAEAPSDEKVGQLLDAARRVLEESFQ